MNTKLIERSKINNKTIYDISRLDYYSDGTENFLFNESENIIGGELSILLNRSKNIYRDFIIDSEEGVKTIYMISGEKSLMNYTIDNHPNGYLLKHLSKFKKYNLSGFFTITNSNRIFHKITIYDNTI